MKQLLYCSHTGSFNRILLLPINIIFPLSVVYTKMGRELVCRPYVYRAYSCSLCKYVCITVCISLCLCMYYACMFECMHACIIHKWLTFIHAHTCINVCMYTCIHLYMYTCIHLYMYTCIHVYTYTFIYLYMYTCIHSIFFKFDFHCPSEAWTLDGTSTQLSPSQIFLGDSPSRPNDLRHWLTVYFYMRQQYSLSLYEITTILHN